MSNRELILPRLPPNLENLHKEEERVRTEALLAIDADVAAKDHVNLIEASLDTIHAFTTMYERRTEDELTIQLLGIRLFNATVSAFGLILGGYYQNSVILLRDLLETGFLVDYLAIDRNKIQEWRRSSDKERQHQFAPLKVREALDEHDNASGKKRGQIYKLMCNYGAHPTFAGFRLVSPNGRGEIGTFYNEKFLKSLLEELVKNVSYFALVYSGHFSNVDPPLLKGKAEFLNDLKEWAAKYLSTEFKRITF
jgi:hypothetical protein